MSSTIQSMNASPTLVTRSDMAAVPVDLVERVQAAKEKDGERHGDVEERSSTDLVAGEGLMLMQRHAIEAGRRPAAASIGAGPLGATAPAHHGAPADAERVYSALRRSGKTAKLFTHARPDESTAPASLAERTTGPATGAWPTISGRDASAGVQAVAQNSAAPLDAVHARVAAAEGLPLSGSDGRHIQEASAGDVSDGSRDKALVSSSTLQRSAITPPVLPSRADIAHSESLTPSRESAREVLTSTAARMKRDSAEALPGLNVAMGSQATAAVTRGDGQPQAAKPASTLLAAMAEAVPKSEATVTVPFTSWGPGHQVVASWAAGVVPGLPGQTVTLRSSTGPVADAVAAGLETLHAAGDGDWKVQSMDTADDSRSGGRQRHGQPEDDE